MSQTLIALCSYVLWFFVYSFAGWVWEVIVSFAQHRRFVNRGFLHGPVLPIYGFGALVAVVLVAPVENLLSAFLVGAAACTVLEYVTSWALERLFRARWWDYEGYFANVNGRVCLLGAVTFGVMCLVVARVANPALEEVTLAMPPLLVVVLAACLACAFLTDLVTSVVHMAGFNRAMALVQERASALAEDAQEALAAKADEFAQGVADGTERMLERAEAGVERVRERAEAATAASRERTEAAREAMADVREQASEAAGRVRDGWAALREAGSTSELRAQLASMAPRLRRVAGHEAHDPEFRPTSGQEAWELVKEALRAQGASRRGRR